MKRNSFPYRVMVRISYDPRWLTWFASRYVENAVDEARRVLAFRQSGDGSGNRVFESVKITRGAATLTRWKNGYRQ